MKLAVIFGGKTSRRRRRPADNPDPALHYAKLKKLIPEARDLFLFGGIASAGYGVYQIYPPSAFVLVGGFFVALGVLIYMGGARE